MTVPPQVPPRLEAALRRAGVRLPANDTGPLPALPPGLEGLDLCTGCGLCLDVCPEYAPDRPFVGAPVLAMIERGRLRATDSAEREGLLDRALIRGGLGDCGQSGNCVEVCPPGVPLLTAIRSLSREATRRLFSRRTP